MMGSRNGPEESFQHLVIDYAKLRGWKTYWLPDWIWEAVFADMKRRSHGRAGYRWPEAGMTDLILCHEERGRLIFAECKTDTGAVQANQRAWMRALRRVPNVEIYLWRPRDFDDLIVPILDAEERPLILPATAAKKPRRRPLDNRSAMPHDSEHDGAN